MNILIAGSDLNAILIAQYIKNQNKGNDIYITMENLWENSDCIPVNIKENDVRAIVDFVKYNQIEFTIVTSPLSVINGLADYLTQEGFPVFAPFSEAAKITYLTSIAKKIMYKLKINTPKFGIFDRENLAIDYVRHSKFPVIIQNDLTLLNKRQEFYDTFTKAKSGIQKIFEDTNEKIIIENYVDSEPIWMYFITDGYNALPLITLERLKGNNFIKIISPSSKISEAMIIHIMRKVIYPLLDDIKEFTCAYKGIIGLKIKLYKNSYFVLEFYIGFQEYDIQAFLPLLDENLVDLLYTTASAQISDNYNYVHLKDKSSYTIAVKKEFIDNSIEENDEFLTESEDKDNYIYTITGSTLDYAKNYIYNFLGDKISPRLKKEIAEDDRKREKRI